MEVFEAIRTMLAVREYQDRPAPQEHIDRIVEAARLTASSKNGQPWHFVVVQDRQRIQRLAELSTSGRYMAGAAFVIAVAVEKASPFGLSDGSRAVQDMALTGWELGLGSNWVGFTGMDAQRDELGIPADYDVIALVPFGYPTRRIGLGRKNRRPLGEVVSRERFGQPYDA